MAKLIKLVLAILVVFQALVVIGCTEPEPEVVVRTLTYKPLKPPQMVVRGSVNWETKFKSATRPPAGRQVARLQFKVASNLDSGGEMELLDAGNPQGATLDGGFCSMQIIPQVNPPRITSERDQECAVAGYYDLQLSDDDGDHIGWFRITEIGMLELKSKSVSPDFDVDLLSTAERILYVVYPHRTAGQDPPPLMALEYLHADCKTVRSVIVGDDWNYTSQFADGLLRALPPACLEGWPEYLRERAAIEGSDRQDYHDAKLKSLERQRAARGIDCDRDDDEDEEDFFGGGR